MKISKIHQHITHKQYYIIASSTDKKSYELSVQNPVDIFNLVDNKKSWDTWYSTGYEWCIT
jgi:hypothetical protein